MSEDYVVEQGDQISGIAEKFGFLNFETIWNHANNATLREQRKNPHVLLPGDVLHIPDKQAKAEEAATGQVHRFQVNRDRLQLRLVLKDFDEEPMAGLDCELEVEGAIFKLKSDSTGLVSAEIPRGARTGTLRIPALDLEIPVAVGELDPHEANAGWIGRLINLGYYENDLEDTNEQLLRAALEEFQCDHKLEVTGKPDDATLQKLREVHGV